MVNFLICKNCFSKKRQNLKNHAVRWLDTFCSSGGGPNRQKWSKLDQHAKDTEQAGNNIIFLTWNILYFIKEEHLIFSSSASCLPDWVELSNRGAQFYAKEHWLLWQQRHLRHCGSEQESNCRKHLRGQDLKRKWEGHPHIFELPIPRAFTWLNNSRPKKWRPFWPLGPGQSILEKSLSIFCPRTHFVLASDCQPYIWVPTTMAGFGEVFTILLLEI